MNRLSLNDTIGAIRSELAQSILAAQDEEIRFELGEIDLEFQIEIERNAEGSGGIRFWIVEFGAKASQSSTVTHRVSLKLKPISNDGRPILTGAQEIPE